MKRLKIYWDNIVYFFTARNRFYRERYDVLWGTATVNNDVRWVNINELIKNNIPVNVFLVEYKGIIIKEGLLKEAFDKEEIRRKKENRNNIIKEVLNEN